MPEPTNPYRTEGSPPGRVDLPIRADAWNECHSAWREWLASDEAVERVAAIIAFPFDAAQGRWRDEAHAVLAALRGDET